MRRNTFERARRETERIARAASTSATERAAGAPSAAYIVQAGGIPSGETTWVGVGLLGITPLGEFRLG